MIGKKNSKENLKSLSLKERQKNGIWAIENSSKLQDSDFLSWVGDKSPSQANLKPLYERWIKLGKPDSDASTVILDSYLKKGGKMNKKKIACRSVVKAQGGANLPKISKKDFSNQNTQVNPTENLPIITQFGQVGRCTEEGCAEWETSYSAARLKMPRAVFQKKVKTAGTDAWTRINIGKAYGTIKEVNPDVEEYQVGDLVDLYRERINPLSDDSYAKAQRPGASGNTHIGVIVGKTKDGEPVVKHNFHRRLLVQPLSEVQGNRTMTYTPTRFGRYLPENTASNVKNKSAFYDKVEKMSDDLRLSHTGEATEYESAFLSGLNDSLSEFQQRYRLSPEEALGLARIAEGILGQESNNEENVVRYGVLTRKFKQGLAKAIKKHPSEGPTQLKRTMLHRNADGSVTNAGMYAGQKGTDLDDPKVAAYETLNVLGDNYLREKGKNPNLSLADLLYRTAATWQGGTRPRHVDSLTNAYASQVIKFSENTTTPFSYLNNLTQNKIRYARDLGVPISQVMDSYTLPEMEVNTEGDSILNRLRSLFNEPQFSNKSVYPTQTPNRKFVLKSKAQKAKEEQERKEQFSEYPSTFSFKKGGKLDKKSMACNSPRKSPNPKKKKVVKGCENGQEKIIHFGATGYSDYTKHKNKNRRSNFRARHNCDTAKSKLTARYWACSHLWRDGGVLSKHQTGGVILSGLDWIKEPFTNKSASKFDQMNQKYKNYSWVNRGLNPSKYPVKKNPDGSFSTHRLAAETDGKKWFVFPTMDLKSDGSWLEFDDPWDAYDYFKAKGEIITFDNKEDALEYSENGLIKHD